MKKLILFLLVSSFNLCLAQGWQPQSSGTTNNFRDLQFLNQYTGWAVGWFNTIVKTTNGGANWFSQTTPFGWAFQGCYFSNTETGWAVGGNGTNNIEFICKTTDGGTTWTSQHYSNLGYLMRTWFVNSSTGWVCGYNGRILKTTDGGTTWTSQLTGISRHLINIIFINENNGFAIGDYGTILRTTTGGALWSPLYSGTTENLEGIHFVSTTYGFVVGYNGTILKTTNGGLNWTPKPSSSTDWLNSACFLNYNTGYITGGNYYNYGIVLKTIDGGENWGIQTLSVTNRWLADIYFINSNTGWVVGHGGTIMKTTNGGLSVPSPPALIFPPNNSINVPVTTTLRWSNVLDADNYTYQISTIPTFSILTDSATVDTNFYNVPYGILTNAITYFWCVKASNSIGSSAWSSIWMFSTLPTGINQISSPIPTKYELYDNYPNPFNPSTRFRFDVPKESRVSIIIYDMLGRAVEKVVDGNVSAGSYLAEWNAGKFNSGVYIIRFVSDGYSATKRILYLK